jgi:hypothetical protein
MNTQKLSESLNYLREASNLLHEPGYYVKGPLSLDEVIAIVDGAANDIADLLAEDSNNDR